MRHKGSYPSRLGGRTIPMRKKQKILLALAGGFVLVVIFISANLSDLKNQLTNLPFFRTPTPTPFKYQGYPVPALLPTGAVVYNGSRGSGSKGPDIYQITLDPIDPKKGTIQKISLKVKSVTDVSMMRVTAETDYRSDTYDANLVQGTKKDGVWQIEVPVNDSHDYIYRVTVEAKDAKDEFSVTLTVR